MLFSVREDLAIQTANFLMFKLTDIYSTLKYAKERAL